ncbi:MAG TPA: hypothetical protein VF615_02620 [Longimicrobiaceae bacterium]|jgi:hypothetical protein
MRRHGTLALPHFRAPALSFLVLLLAAACGDEDRTQTGYTPSNDRTSTSLDDTSAVPARAVPWPDTAPATLPPQDTLGLALAPLGDALVRGSGQVAAVGTSTSISVALTQAMGGATYEGAVRQGSCARFGAAVASLVPATADSLGGGRSSSDVPVPVDSLTGAPHVVVYGRGGRPEACGPIGGAAARAGTAAPLPPPGPSPADTVPADTVRRRAR